MIDGVTNTEGIASLERLVQFAGQRHRLIVNNIANFDTPGYRPTDVSVTDFQEQLGDAGFAVRTGGDEFGLLLAGDEPEARIVEAIQTVRAVASLEGRKGAPEVSISVGLVTLLPGVEVSLDVAYQAADRELYQAKEGKEADSSMVRISQITMTRSSRGSGGARNSER